MSRLGTALALAAAALIAGTAAAPARAAARDGFTIDILVDGVPLREYAARGTTYVEALKGKEYAVRIRNPLPERVGVALAVDGLNSIDAKRTSAREGSKWILGPYETIVITGWQTGDATARQFYFTDEKGSYGAWLGRTNDLGVVAAAFFREKRRPIAYDRDLRKDASAQAPAAGVPAPELQGRMREESAREKKVAADEFAATGIGRETEHQVQRVTFDEEDAPSALVSVRYEYRPALVRLGVLPPAPDRDALARRERARGFADNGYCPDPGR